MSVSIYSKLTSKFTKLILIAAVGFTVSGCKEDLYTKISTETEAKEMLSVLLNNNIDAKSTVAKDGTNVLKVESSQLSEAIELLKSKGYPKQTFTGFCDTFKGTGFVASPTEERARLTCALNDEISRSLARMNGVLSARVIINMPKNDPFKMEKSEGSASVTIQHEADIDMIELKPSIKMTVANSVEGLTYGKVSVNLIPVIKNKDDLAASRSVATENSIFFYGTILGAVLTLIGAIVLLYGTLSNLFNKLFAGKGMNTFPSAQANLGAAE